MAIDHMIRIPCSHDDASNRPRKSFEVKIMVQVFERLTVHFDDDERQPLITTVTLSDLDSVIGPVNPLNECCKPTIINFFKSLGKCERCCYRLLKDLQDEVKKELKEIDYSYDKYHYEWKIDAYFDRDVYSSSDDEVLRSWAEMISFEEAVVGPTPASEAAIETLLERSAIQENDENIVCTICLEDLKPKEQEEETTIKKAMLPCKHEFHEDCIVEWLHNSCFCPLCRFELPAESIDDDS